MRSRSPIKTLAMLTAALGVGLGGQVAASNPHAGKGAILQLPRQYSKRDLELLKAGGSPYRNRNPWPYRGKNRAQRQRLSAGFMAMS